MNFCIPYPLKGQQFPILQIPETARYNGSGIINGIPVDNWIFEMNSLPNGSRYSFVASFAKSNTRLVNLFVRGVRHEPNGYGNGERNKDEHTLNLLVTRLEERRPEESKFVVPGLCKPIKR